MKELNGANVPGTDVENEVIDAELQEAEALVNKQEEEEAAQAPDEEPAKEEPQVDAEEVFNQRIRELPQEMQDEQEDIIDVKKDVELELTAVKTKEERILKELNAKYGGGFSIGGEDVLTLSPDAFNDAMDALIDAAADSGDTSILADVRAAKALRKEYIAKVKEDKLDEKRDRLLTKMAEEDNKEWERVIDLYDKMGVPKENLVKYQKEIYNHIEAEQLENPALRANLYAGGIQAKVAYLRKVVTKLGIAAKINADLYGGKKGVKAKNPTSVNTSTGASSASTASVKYTRDMVRKMSLEDYRKQKSAIEAQIKRDGDLP